MADTLNYFSSNVATGSYALTTYPDSTYQNVLISSSGSGVWDLILNVPNANPTNAAKLPLVTGSGDILKVYTYGMCSYYSTINSKYFVVCATSKPSIELMYDLAIPSFASSSNPTLSATGNSTYPLTTSTSWYTSTANMTTTTNLALQTIDSTTSYLFFTLKSGCIGQLTITDASTKPNQSSGNETYIGTSVTGGSSTLYPTGITIDTNGLLYTVLGSGTTNPTVDTSIKVIDITGSPTLKYSITYLSTSYSSYGYPYSLFWYNNNLFVGTYKGTFAAGTAGYIFTYSTLYARSNNIPSQTSFRSSKSVAGMVAINNYLYTSNLNGTTVVIDKYTLHNNVTKFNFNLNGTNIDIGSIFNSPGLGGTTTNNLGAGSICNYYVDASNVNTLYLNNSTNNKLNLNTNYYILVSGKYYDISIFFNRNSNMNPYFSTALIPLSSTSLGRAFYYIMNNTGTPITNTLVMPFTKTAYIICIGGGGNGSNGTGGSGGGFCYTEVSLVGGTIYNISVGGVASATTFSSGADIISAGGGTSNTITGGGVASVTFANSTNTIKINGNTGNTGQPGLGGSNINGGLNIVNLTSINSNFITDMRTNSTTSGASYDNNIAIGCGAYGTNNGYAVYIDGNGNPQNGATYSAIYTPTGSLKGTGTGNGGGGGTGSATNSGGGGIIYIYF